MSRESRRWASWYGRAKPSMRRVSWEEASRCLGCQVGRGNWGRPGSRILGSRPGVRQSASGSSMVREVTCDVPTWARRGFVVPIFLSELIVTESQWRGKRRHNIRARCSTGGSAVLNSNPGYSPARNIVFVADPRRGHQRSWPLGPNRRENCSQVGQSGCAGRNRSVGSANGRCHMGPSMPFSPICRNPDSPDRGFRGARSAALFPARNHGHY